MPCHARHSLKISERSVHNFLSYLADKQTNKTRQKHNLLGGGDNTLFSNVSRSANYKQRQQIPTMQSRGVYVHTFKAYNISEGGGSNFQDFVGRSVFCEARHAPNSCSAWAPPWTPLKELTTFPELSNPPRMKIPLPFPTPFDACGASIDLIFHGNFFECPWVRIPSSAVQGGMQHLTACDVGGVRH